MRVVSDSSSRSSSLNSDVMGRRCLLFIRCGYMVESIDSIEKYVRMSCLPNRVTLH